MRGRVTCLRFFLNDHSVKLISLKNTQLFETLSFPNKVTIAFALMYVLVSIRIGFIKFKKKNLSFFFPFYFTKMQKIILKANKGFFFFFFFFDE